MEIRTRMCMSADGCVTTPDGWPVQLADPAFAPGESYGFPKFQESSSHTPEGTPEEVVVESDPEVLLEQVRAANRGGDVHLVGGPRTIETVRALGALDKLGLIVLPLLTGEGMRLTPSLSTDARLTLESQRALATGAVEIVYDCA